MRPLIIFATVGSLATFARADQYRGTAVEARTLPPACAPLVWVPADARTMTPTLEAYTSIAGCIVRERTRGLDVQPVRNSVDELELAIRPAIDLLDTVIETGDLEHQIVALHAKADIYDGLVVRMRNAAAHNPGHARNDVEELTADWRSTAHDLNRKVVALGERVPELVKHNPVLASVVRDSRTSNAPGVASR